MPWFKDKYLGCCAVNLDTNTLNLVEPTWEKSGGLLHCSFQLRCYTFFTLLIPQAVYDLTWEILQEIFAEDPNTDQPQWVKPRRVMSSLYHRVRTPGDVTKIQVQFCTARTTNRTLVSESIYLHLFLLQVYGPVLMPCNVFFYVAHQEFIAAEVLKLYGLAKDQDQKTDWQKMLKFGRKKRDRVDHILVGPEVSWFLFARVFICIWFQTGFYHLP